jgi:Mg2+/Co2+ transporter CorC
LEKKNTKPLILDRLLPFLSEKDDFDWKSLIRKPYFIPENKKIDDLLREFQSMKMHMAVVVDEYGGASGIVTLEDVLEEIVGDATTNKKKSLQ